MAENQPVQHKRRSRMMRLLNRLRPNALPVTYRHNRVVLFHNGTIFFTALFAALRAAEHTILVEYYLIRNDTTGQLFATALQDAAARGVQVYLIYDYIGCLDTPSSYFKQLASHGICLTPFNVPSFKRGVRWFDRRDHRKMTIIDHKLAFLGGFNVGDEYADTAPHPQRFRDAGFSVAGTSINELTAIFCRGWMMEQGVAPQFPVSHEQLQHSPGSATVSFIPGAPLQLKPVIRSAFLFNITSASEELLIANPYFVPGPRIIRALLRAARRGVRVRLLMPARSDVPLVQLVGRSFYGVLLRGGIEIREMQSAILHAKVMLVDGERTFIGSANLDQRSFHRNYEINGIIDSSAFGRQIRSMLEEDFAAAEPVQLNDHEARGWGMRLLERVVRLFSWFL